MAAAAALAAGPPGADLPDPAFIERLRTRLTGELEEKPGEPPPATRRQILKVAGIGLAAALAGGVLGKSLGTLPTASEQTSIVPANGSWRPVLAVAQLPAGGAVAYSTAAMEVLVVNDRGTVRALSATCTPLGCRLAANPSTRRFDCPCHRTAFAFDGTVASHELPAAPPTLPLVRSRVRDGTIEVFVA